MSKNTDILDKYQRRMRAEAEREWFTPDGDDFVGPSPKDVALAVFPDPEDLFRDGLGLGLQDWDSVWKSSSPREAMENAMEDWLTDQAAVVVRRLKPRMWAVTRQATRTADGVNVPKHALVAPDEVGRFDKSALKAVLPEHLWDDSESYLNALGPGGRNEDYAQNSGMATRRENFHLDYNEAQSLIDDLNANYALPDDTLNRILNHRWRHDPTDLTRAPRDIDEVIHAEIEEVLGYPGPSPEMGPCPRARDKAPGASRSR